MLTKSFYRRPEIQWRKTDSASSGHQEMELALVKLYKVTGKELYLEMAEKFLEIREDYVPDGEGVMSPTMPKTCSSRKQKEAVGHAVRPPIYIPQCDAGLKQKLPTPRHFIGSGGHHRYENAHHRRFGSGSWNRGIRPTISLTQRGCV